jgi:hypothetical protein
MESSGRVDLNVAKFRIIFLAYVKAHPPLGVRASVDRGVEIVVIITAGKHGGS